MSLDANTSPELDFEDMLSQFEHKFRNCGRGRDLYPQNRTSLSEEPRETHPSFIKDLKPELGDLWEELVHHIQLTRQATLKLDTQKDTPAGPSTLDIGFTKEVFRAEVRTTLSEIRKIHDAQHEDSANLTTSQRSTIASLKRRLRERTEERDTLRHKLKQVEVEKYRLEDRNRAFRTSVAEYEEDHATLEREIYDVNKRCDFLNKRLTDAANEHRRGQFERERLQTTVARLRQEIVGAHHETVSVRLEAKHAKDRVEDLEKRAAETKASSSAVLARVTELQHIQDEMVSTMRATETHADAPAARRALATLAEQRTRVVGKIASLLTRNRRNDNQEAPAHNTLSSPNVSKDAIVGTTSFQGLSQTSPAVHVTDSSDEGPSSPGDGDNGGRKMRFGGIRKFGNELTRAATNRVPARRAMLANVEKTREAVEKDTRALRDVIEMKESELERMERELYDAKDHAASLEKALQLERQKRRLENRNMRVPAVEQARMEMTESTTSRRKRQTLFQWQTSHADSEDSEHDEEDGNDSKAPATRSVAQEMFSTADNNK